MYVQGRLAFSSLIKLLSVLWFTLVLTLTFPFSWRRCCCVNRIVVGIGFVWFCLVRLLRFLVRFLILWWFCPFKKLLRFLRICLSYCDFGIAPWCWSFVYGRVVVVSVWEISIFIKTINNHWLVCFLLPGAACLNLSIANAILWMILESFQTTMISKMLHLDAPETVSNLWLNSSNAFTDWSDEIFIGNKWCWDKAITLVVFGKCTTKRCLLFGIRLVCWSTGQTWGS